MTGHRVILAIFVLSGCGSGQGADPGAGGAGGEGGAGGAGGGIVPAACASDTPTPVRIWRLTASQYDNTLADVLGDRTRPGAKFIVGANSAGYLNDAASGIVTRQVAEGYRAAAKTIARNLVAGSLPMLLPCAPADPANEGCVQKFIADFGKKAFRAPLDEDTRARLFRLYQIGAKSSPGRGIEVVMEAILQAPEFAYRLEVGTPSPGPTTELTQHELASYLAYTLWNTAPDATLTALADAGQLGGPAIAAQVKRLLADPRARPVVGDFFVQVLGLEQLPTVAKDTAVFKTWKDTMTSAMRDEVSAFGQHVVFDAGGLYTALFTANFSFVNATLAGIYKVTGVTGTTPVKTALNPMERSGVLTQPGFLATFAKEDTTDPIARGKEVRERLMCQELPEPPPNLAAVEPPPSPNLTARQRYDMHRTNPSCAACHMLIDPVGLAFENYDGMGAYRTMDGRLPIDAAGEMVGSKDLDGKFVGVVELARKLSGSAQVRDCMATQYFRYAAGRHEGAGDACTLDSLKKTFAASSGNLATFIETVAGGDLARARAR